MISNDAEFEVTLARMQRCQRQLAALRQAEQNPGTYRLSAGGFLAEMDRMALEVRQYLSLHPAELLAAPGGN